MKVKVSETTRIQLDWLVAKCEKQYPSKATGEPFLYEHRLYQQNWCPSTDPAQGQPILEREIDTIRKRSAAEEATLRYPNPNFKFKAEKFADIDGYVCGFGPTMLIAGLRCYVSSKLGNEVEIPEELS